MSATAPKEKTGSFWKKLGLGKQKSSGERTPSRPASILSRASSTDKLSVVAANIPVEPSESTRRNKRLSLISGYNHRTTISETTGNVNRSHSTMTMAVPDDTRHLSRATSQTLNVTSTKSDRLLRETLKEPTSYNTAISEDESTLLRTRGTMQINSPLRPKQSLTRLTEMSDPQVPATHIEVVQPTQPSIPLPDSSHITDSHTDNSSVELLNPIPQPSPTLSANSEPKSSMSAESYPAVSSTPSRSNLPKLNSLRGSSSSIPRTSSGSSLRQPGTTTSRLRQPSTSVKSISSYDTLKEPPHSANLESLTIASTPAISNLEELETDCKQKEHVKEIYYSLDEDTPSSSREIELLADLEQKRNVIRVLQGQKTAIGKDLEFLNQMVEDLEAENERLREQCETQKQQNEHSIQDMDLLLEKVKSANANARDAERAQELLRRELEVQNLQVESKHSQYEDRLAKKEKEIVRLTTQLEQSKEQIKVLKSTMEQLLRVNVVNKKEEDVTAAVSQTPDRMTPATSPDIQSMNISFPLAVSQRHSVTSIESEERYVSPRRATQSSQEEFDRNTSPSSNRGSVISTLSKRDSMLVYDDEGDDLDDQMRMLVKQKERLQSDYSKIPIIGGGPQSRKRKEDLEEQLDSIDSQLSKIKLKLRSRA
ncbi:hypothetical protein Unana1_00258 [Umbelopsis nana]